MSTADPTNETTNATSLPLIFKKFEGIISQTNIEELIYETTPKPISTFFEIRKALCTEEDSRQVGCQNNQPCFRFAVGSSVNFECE